MNIIKVFLIFLTLFLVSCFVEKDPNKVAEQKKEEELAKFYVNNNVAMYLRLHKDTVTQFFGKDYVLVAGAISTIVKSSEEEIRFYFDPNTKKIEAITRTMYMNFLTQQEITKVFEKLTESLKFDGFELHHMTDNPKSLLLRNSKKNIICLVGIAQKNETIAIEQYFTIHSLLGIRNQKRTSYEVH